MALSGQNAVLINGSASVMQNPRRQGITHAQRPRVKSWRRFIYMHLSTIGIVVSLAFLLFLMPLCSDAQQPGKIYRIVFLSALSPPLPSTPTPALDAFWQQLHELGWIEGQNIVIERRWAETRFARH
jgi:hypothetical protein